MKDTIAIWLVAIMLVSLCSCSHRENSIEWVYANLSMDLKYSTYTNRERAIKFSYPSAWVIKFPNDCRPDYKCQVFLRPDGYLEQSMLSEYEEAEWVIMVEMLDAYTEKVIARDFEKRSGHWYIDGGRAGLRGAEVLSQHGHICIRGCNVMGVYENSGGYAGLGHDYCVATLFVGKGRSARITLYDRRFQPVFEKILKTFRFLQMSSNVGDG